MYLGLPPRKTAEQHYEGIPQAKSLAEFFDVDSLDFQDVDLSTYAHLIIDPQRHYADPTYSPRGTKHTDQISEKIAKITPLFRASGIQTALVYFDWNLSDNFNDAMGGLYKVDAGPQYNDIMIPKCKSDAFEGGFIHEHLQQSGIENLFVSGFNATACVSETVFSALRKNYNVALLEDCIGQNKNQEGDTPRYISLMMKQGAQRSHSDEALDFLLT